MKANAKIGLATAMAVFSVNMAENIIHYNYGRTGGRLSGKVPPARDIGKMILTSIVAGIIVTSIVSAYANNNGIKHTTQ